ncbi:MAG TPA: type II toxin-antitoxin system VapC family toxin [Thermoanaerobaculia bacterium]|nr:type II toxin-antitoxin system VapC family toxin [Thermoanaerobaculia bacterium]
MRAVDTNVLVRLITGDDERQAVVAEAFVNRGVWISHVVLVETAWVLRRAYKLDDAGIAAAIEMLLNQEAVSLQDADVVTSALDQYRLRPSLGFSDCLVIEIARKAGHLPLGTFDKNLAKLDGAERL